MGLWDSLTSVFTGDPQKEASAQSRAYIDAQNAQIRGDVAGAKTQGLDLLRAGQTGALGTLGQGFEQGRTDTLASLDPSLNALYGGSGQGAGALYGGADSGIAALMSGVQGAQSAYNPLSDLAQRYSGSGDLASQMSESALGLRGPAGVQAAQDAFKTGPGYQFAVDQGLEGVARNANVAGGALSGNALREAQTYGQGLANQEYGNWLKNLQARETLYNPLAAGALGQVAQGQGNAALTGGTGAANIYTGTAGRLSDLYSGTGKGAADIYGRTGQTLADLASKGGLAGAGIYTDTAGRGAGLVGDLTKTGVGFQQGALDNYTSSYDKEAAAAMQGGKNLWGALGGAAKLISGLG